jgi:DNA-binding SARP family transcriptional activator/tetratricopeptide (TPR) repeat protein/DNA-binding XRE family transcriptional regulator
MDGETFVRPDLLGLRIRGLRRARGLTQEEVAARAKIGVATVRDLEQGRVPRLRQSSLRQLAAAFGVDAGELAIYGVPEGNELSDSAPPSGLMIGVCGPLVIERNGVEFPAIPASQRALLGLLALSAGKAVKPESLIEAIWPEEPPVTAVAIVQTYVSRLRRLLRESHEADSCISRDGAGYRLRLDADGLDLLAFRQLVTQAREAPDDSQACHLFERAMRLWRGCPLEDVEVLRDHPAVTAVANEHVQVALEYAQRAAALGRHDMVLGDLMTLAANNPLDEPLHAALMVALAGSGRQAQSLSVYEELRRRLDEELGMPPSDELRAAHQRVLRQEVVPGKPKDAPRALRRVSARQRGAGTAKRIRHAESESATPGRQERPTGWIPAQLPADIADFTGRSDVITHLCSVLSTHGSRENPGAVQIVVVAGAGGLGKTRLAIHTAHRLRSRYPDGQIYVDLLGTTANPQAPTDVLTGFLHELGLDSNQIPATEDGRAALFRTRLSERAVLLLLDNARDAAQVRPLLPGSSSCAVIVTARSRMPDLPSTQLVDLEVFDDDESLALFTRIVGEKRTAAERDSAAKVLASCAGLPLAIRICAARLAVRSRWSIQALAERLSARLLDELKTGDMAVRASFQISFDSLPREVARAFRLLGLWQGSFISLPAAAALFGGDEDETAEALEVLVDAYLLESPAPDQYRFHDLLRVYAAERAQAEENAQERDAALRRLLEWYLYSVDAAATVISPHRSRPPVPEPPPDLRSLTFTTSAEAMGWIESERRNIVAAALAAEAVGLDAVAWLLPVSLLVFFNRRGYHSDWITMHQAALASVRRIGDKAGEAHVLTNLGMGHSPLDPESAVGYLEQALEICRSEGDPRGVAQALSNLQHIHLTSGRLAEVVSLGDEALPIHQAVGNIYGEGITVSNIAEAYLGLGQVSEAVEYLRQGGEIFGRTGDSRGQANVLLNLGDAYLAQGRTDEAVESYQGAVETFRSAWDQPGEARALLRLGQACAKTGLTADARMYLSQAGVLFRALSDETHAAVASSELSSIRPGDPEDELN